jgi:hypothetical protein
MFTPENIQTRLRDRPFVPLRIVTTTGHSFDVYHPDLVLVGQRFLIVGLPSAGNPTVAEQVSRVALIHVTELQDLPPVTPSNNSPPQA